MIQTFSCQLCENRRQDTISMATETMLERDVRKEEVVDKGSGYNYGRKWTYLGNGKSSETFLARSTWTRLRASREVEGWIHGWVSISISPYDSVQFLNIDIEKYWLVCHALGQVNYIHFIPTHSTPVFSCEYNSRNSCSPSVSQSLCYAFWQHFEIFSIWFGWI